MQIKTSSALLTYKGKILLQSPDLPSIGQQQHLWCLIGAGKIKYTTRLELKNLQKKNEYFYHVELTDNDVNSIERRDGQKLEFYTLVELDKLTLSSETSVFILNNKNTVEELLAH